MYGFKIPKKKKLKVLPTLAQLRAVMIQTEAQNLTELVCEVNKLFPEKKVEGSDIAGYAVKFRKLVRKVKAEIEAGDAESDGAVASELKRLGVKKIEKEVK